jgi:hypothetical protein
MSTTAPDPYHSPGWTIQHQHRTSAEPQADEEVMIDIPLPEVTEETPAPKRKPRSRAKLQA